MHDGKNRALIETTDMLEQQLKYKRKEIMFRIYVHAFVLIWLVLI